MSHCPAMKLSAQVLGHSHETGVELVLVRDSVSLMVPDLVTRSVSEAGLGTAANIADASGDVAQVSGIERLPTDPIPKRCLRIQSGRITFNFAEKESPGNRCVTFLSDLSAISRRGFTAQSHRRLHFCISSIR